MANPHFGNLGDVWKHVALAEALASERPLNYWETHAGSAIYLLSHSPARDYGAYYLLEGGRRSSILSQSPFYQELKFFPGTTSIRPATQAQRFSQCVSSATEPTTFFVT
jgi:23S rRNA A2030 N6-methylase RlmJ